jgi:hypothetical protein
MHKSRPARPRRQRCPNKQASLERRRRLARQSPVPPHLIDRFTTSEHAVITVVAGEIGRAGACRWCIDRIAAIAGVCATTVRNTMHKARLLGLLISIQRRRRGQKSLTNVVQALRKSWAVWLFRIAYKKTQSTTDKDSQTAAVSSGEGRKRLIEEDFRKHRAKPIDVSVE